MGKVKEIGKVISQEELQSGIFSMWIKTKNIAKEAKQGQFISVYCKDNTKLLPRPISLCEVDKENDALRIVYRVAGDGTREFSSYKCEDDINILGPLGNGFELEDKPAILVAGGIGIPPMVELAKQLKKSGVNNIFAFLGYRDKNTFLLEELNKYAKVFIATEDGSLGTKGNVIDAMNKENLDNNSVIYSCGPTPMLRALKNFAAKKNMKCFVSLEEKMACGIGACLACVCKSKEKDSHSHVHNKRICKDGPVFNALDIEI